MIKDKEIKTDNGSEVVRIDDNLMGKPVGSVTILVMSWWVRLGDTIDEVDHCEVSDRQRKKKVIISPRDNFQISEDRQQKKVYEVCFIMNLTF